MQGATPALEGIKKTKANQARTRIESQTFVSDGFDTAKIFITIDESFRLFDKQKMIFF